jgi:hypothetical protein
LRSRPLALSRTPVAPEALALTGEYSILGLTGAADQAAVRERQVGFTLVLFGVATAIAVLYSIERYFYSRLVGAPVSLTQLVPAELIFTYSWALLTPLVMFGAKRFPVWGQQPTRNWAVQLAAMLMFVVAHNAIFSLSLALLDATVAFQDAPRLFWQSLLAWTVLDALVFCVIIIIHHAVVYYRVSKDRELRASQLETRLAQSQLQMLRMQLQPHFLFNTLHSISALMHKDGGAPTRWSPRSASAAHVAPEHRRAGSAAPIGARLPPALHGDHVTPVRRSLAPLAVRRSRNPRRPRAEPVPSAAGRKLIPSRVRRPGTGLDRHLGSTGRRHAPLRRDRRRTRTPRRPQGRHWLGEHSATARAFVRRTACLCAARRSETFM